MPSKYNYTVSKLPKFLNSAENPDVVIISSSLTLIPAARCDDRMAGRPETYRDWFYWKYVPTYTHAKYLESLLAQKGLPVDIKNMGMASAVMSDHAAVLDAILSHGKRPGLVICGVAPRDFMDDCQQLLDQTPTQLVLKELGARPKLVPDNFSEKAISAWREGNEHQIKKVFALLKTSSANLTNSLLRSKQQALEEQGNAPIGQEHRPNFEKELRSYHHVYNPPNFALIAKQKLSLDLLLETAQKNNIPVLLVNMPNTIENTAEIDPRAFKEYLSIISRSAHRYNAVLLDIGSASPDYTRADFEDCCHLNAQGGEKLFAALTRTISGNEQLANALRRHSAAIAGNHCAKKVYRQY